MSGNLRGKRVLVTGASSGIGTSFARQLAQRGANLVISARRKDRLDALAEELRKAHGIEVDVVAADLGKPDGARAIFAATEGAGKTIDVVVNNAGFGTKCEFVELPWEKTLEEMQLNLVSLTELSKRFGLAMKARRAGHILNVSSVGAYLPTPNFASYAAGKAYVRNFSHALAYELRPHGVRVCCLCPGGTETEFAKVAGIDLQWWQKLAFMSADRCASIGLRALFAGRWNIISGFWNAVAMFSLRWIPIRLQAAIGARAL